MNLTIRGLYGSPPVRPSAQEDEHGQERVLTDHERSPTVAFRVNEETNGPATASSGDDLGGIFGGMPIFNAKARIIEGLSPGANNDLFFQDEQANPALGSNLKTIVEDDRQWDSFASGVLCQQSDSAPIQTLRNRLFDGFDQDMDFDDMTNLIDGYARGETGIDQRIDLWLQHTDFFNNMIETIQSGDLQAHPEIYTDPLLIRYIDTFDE